MISAGIFDAKAIADRRRQLFPPAEEPVKEWLAPSGMVDRERFGTTRDHCGICPKRADEACGLNCMMQREATKDGVTVT